MGIFDHFVRSCFAQTQLNFQIFRGGLVLEGWYLWDQIQMQIGPNQTFLSEQWGFKFVRGALDAPSPSDKGLLSNYSNIRIIHSNTDVGQPRHPAKANKEILKS